nr:uncharacterized protein LOC109163082 [Ipomoea batatas]
MVLVAYHGRGKRRGPPSAVVSRGKKFKVSQSEAGGSGISDDDDAFALPPLAFLSKLQQDPV